MRVRENFVHDLKEIKQEIINLTEMTKDALHQSVHALFNRDTSLAKEIMINDRIIDQKEVDLDKQVILLIATQQPVAKDLRRLITALKIANDLERMGDNAKNIAEATLILGGEHTLPIHPIIQTMANKAMSMTDIAIRAFETEDVSLVHNFEELDDVVDGNYELIVRELLSEKPVGEEERQSIMQMAFCARYIERFADHVTNIAESTLFLIKGESQQLN